MSRYVFLGVVVVFLSVIMSVVVFYVTERTIKEYYEDGKIKTIYTIRKGKIEGAFLEYYPNGIVRAKVFYEKGIKEDTFKLFHANGSLQELSIYVNGKKEGMYKEYYSNKTLKVSGWAKGDYKDSLFTYYSSVGAIDSVVMYSKGKMLNRFVFRNQDVDYFDASQSFRLRFSDRWEAVKDPRVLFFLRTDLRAQTDAVPTLNIIKYRNKAGAIIRSVVDSYLEGMRIDVPSFRANAISFSQDQCLIRYTTHYNNQPFVALASIHLNGLDHYVITCVTTKDSFIEVEKDFKSIIESFQFVNKQEGIKVSKV